MAILNQLVTQNPVTIHDVEVGEVFRFRNPYGYLAIVSDNATIMNPTPNGFEAVRLTKYSLIELCGGDPTVVNFVSKDNLINYLTEKSAFRVHIETQYTEASKSSRKSLGLRGETYYINDSIHIVARRQEEVFNPNSKEVVYRHEHVINSKGKTIHCIIQLDSQLNSNILLFDTNEYLEWYLKSSEVMHIDVHLSEYHEDRIPSPMYTADSHE